MNDSIAILDQMIEALKFRVSVQGYATQYDTKMLSWMDTLRLLADKPPTTQVVIPWDTAPEWATWAATDACGGSYWFETEPVLGPMQCWVVQGKKVKFKRIMEINPDWKNTAVKRPI